MGQILCIIGRWLCWRSRGSSSRAVSYTAPLLGEERNEAAMPDDQDHDDDDHDQPPPPRDQDRDRDADEDEGSKVLFVVAEQLIVRTAKAKAKEKKKRKRERERRDSDMLMMIVRGRKHRAIMGSCCSPERTRSIGPYSSSQRILLVGEGDFSFSASLAVAFGSASNLTATSLDLSAFLKRNYKSFLSNKSKLVSRGAVVLHYVDATKMAADPKLRGMRFDCIVYNFPHAGFRQQETPESQTRRNQELVRGFLRNAKEMLDEEEGEIHVTHKSNRFFRQWDLPRLGAEQGLYMFERVDFSRADYPGYHTKYGYGGDKDFDCDPSKTYKFCLTLPKHHQFHFHYYYY